MAEAAAHGWEGIVVKDARSPYRPGRRTLRVAQAEAASSAQELVVGGFTEPRGARGSLRRAAAGRADGRAAACATPATWAAASPTRSWRASRRLLAEREDVDVCPFDSRPPANEQPHWVRPSWSSRCSSRTGPTEGYLRQPIYLGLRDDVAPASLAESQAVVPARPSAVTPGRRADAAARRRRRPMPSWRANPAQISPRSRR